MKYAKSAAVVAGSLLALGSWTPAFADAPAPAPNPDAASDFAAGADGPNFALDDGLAQATRKHSIVGAALREGPVGVSGPQVDGLKKAVLGGLAQPK
ncbi:hypothetical protein [Streptomyces sp. ODS28]|uniref:hypothetical protein n=1 Tax=Streptomyces sp. ODS28 TaxID=3136688 RepID=UPI0031E84AAE